MAWVAPECGISDKYIRFCNYPANDHGDGGLNRIYLATAKAGGILFGITPLGNRHRLLYDQRINFGANTFERDQSFACHLIL